MRGGHGARHLRRPAASAEGEELDREGDHVTAYLKPGAFSVAEGHSEVPEVERRRRWDETFGRACAPCAALAWAQCPWDKAQCPTCEQWFCKQHLDEHVCLKNH